VVYSCENTQQNVSSLRIRSKQQNTNIMYQEFHSKSELYNLIKGKTLYIGISGNDGCIRITMAALKEYLKNRKYANGEVYIEDWYVQIFFAEYE